MIEYADVAVIGAGITGLAAALGAERAGASVVVLEAADRAGGVVNSLRVNGFTIEEGPNTFAASAPTLKLLHELGLAADITTPSPLMKQRYIVRDGLLHALPHSPGTLWSSDLLSWRGKLRALSEIAVPRRTQNATEESVASLVRRRFGEEILNYVVDPFVSGVYAGDASELSSRHALRMLAQLEQQHSSVIIGALKKMRARRDAATSATQIISFREGLGQLPDTLLRSVRTTVRTRTVVSAVERNSSGWRVFANSPDGQRVVQARAIVSALPAYALSSIAWDAQLAQSFKPLRAVKYVPVSTVSLGFARDTVTHALDGFGMLVPSVEGRGILGALFSSSMFPERAPSGQVLVTAFLGGARNAILPSHNEVASVATSEVRSLLGIGADHTFAHVTQLSRAIPQFQIGHDEVNKAAELCERTYQGLVLAGSYLRGVSMDECLLSGLAAAERATKSGFE